MSARRADQQDVNRAVRRAAVRLCDLRNPQGTLTNVRFPERIRAFRQCPAAGPPGHPTVVRSCLRDTLIGSSNEGAGCGRGPRFRFSMSKRRRVALVGTTLSFVLAGTVHAATVVGSSSRDVIRGTSKADELYGLSGNDRMYGASGADLLIGSFGNDLLVGGPSADVLLGGPGSDRLDGGPGPDTMIGGNGSDLLVAKDGARDFVDCGA